MCQCCHKAIIYIDLNGLCHIRLPELFFEKKKSGEFGTESWGENPQFHRLQPVKLRVSGFRCRVSAKASKRIKKLVE
jgi:hypothetical protein